MKHRKSTLMRLIELQRGQPIEELLAQLSEHYSLIEEIADNLGIEPSTAYKWMVQFGFEKRWVKPEPVKE